MKRILLLICCAYFWYGSHAQYYRLVDPKNGFVFSSDTIAFKWSAVDSAVSYDLSVATDSLFSNVVFSKNSISATSYQTILATGSQYYWRIMANTSHGPQSWSYSRLFNIFSPSQIAGLNMWFDAAQQVVNTGGKVTQWSDLSSSTLVATPSTGSSAPTFVSSVAQLNNKPAVYFNGSAYLNYANLSFTNYTVLMVRNFSQGNIYIQYVLGGASSGICSQGEYYNSGYGSYSNITNTDSYFGSTESDLTTNYSIYTTEPSRVFRNGVSPILGHTSTIPGISIGCIGTKTSNTYFAYVGDIAEIVLYNDTIPDAQRLLAEGYLRCKYSNFVDLGPDTILQKFCVNVTLQAKATLNSSATFTSYLWSTGATTSSINVTNFGSYSITATDLFGYKSYDTIAVRPIVRFNQLPAVTSLCQFDSVVWNSNYPSTGYTFSWSNGSTASSIVIKTPGTYYVKIKDTYGCYFYSDTIRVLVDSFPSFKMPKDTSFCAGNQLKFNYSGTINSILWSDGDTSQATAINTPGEYSVSAVNGNGCKVADTTQVFIKGIAPSVNFSNTTPCLGDTILFADSSQAPAGHKVIAWLWDFDNIDSSHLEDPTYVFTSFGANTVSLTAITDSGCVNTITKSLQVNFKPQAYFLSNTACAVAKTQFTDYSTTFAPAYITNWDWQFGAGDSSTMENPVYSFPSPGVYRVSLQVINSDGCSDTQVDSIPVYAPFIANFSASNVCIGDTTDFKDITKSFSVIHWLWSFGDGATLANVPDPTHQYASAKTYDVNLLIENAIGCIDSVTKPVKIVTYPTAAFNNLAVCVNAPYTPLDSSTSASEPIGAWQWNINDTSFNVRAPHYVFTDTGSYPVTLTVTTVSGCQNSITQNVYSAPLPVAEFTFNPLFGQAPVSVTFNNLSKNADSYLWNFGDTSGITNEVSPEHTYIYDDTFQITLLAMSPFGCADSASSFFIARPTYLDLSVDGVQAADSSMQDGTSIITVTVKCSNLGTRPISEITFLATIGTGGTIIEEWNGLLQSGYRMNYTFTAQFVTDSSTYVCVDAISVNNGQTETRTDNNYQCGLISGAIQLVGPYPNPAAPTDQPYLGIILQQAGQVTIDITDMLGKYIVSSSTLKLPTGRSNFSIPVARMSAGQYLISVQYDDEIFVKKFMVK